MLILVAIQVANACVGESKCWHFVGAKIIFSPRLIFTIPIIMHNFSYNPIISYY